MPVRRRLQAVTEKAVNAVSCFRWSRDGAGLDHMLGDPHYRTESEARAAWHRARRAVWSKAHRFSIPSTARYFDGLSMRGLEFVRWHCMHLGPFDLTGALAALAADHAALLDFEQRRVAAKQIDDYLVLLRADLAEIERTARALAVFTGPEYLRPYPNHLSTAARYGDGTAATDANGED